MILHIIYIYEHTQREQEYKERGRHSQVLSFLQVGK